MKAVAFATLLAFLSAPAAAAGLDSPTRSLDAAAALRSAASVAEEVGAPYAVLAGSRDNAIQLARGLYSGKVIALRTPDANGNPSLIAFDLPTGGMSWSDVQAVLSLTRSTLARHGVREPTGADVHAALLGGTIQKPDGSAVNLAGVLTMRTPLPTAINHGTGMPIYGATPELPAMHPTWWANYKPVQRPSHQIEHETGVVLAGYLR